MKIIFLKNFKKWNKNDIVELSDGFVKNFLIKKKIVEFLNKNKIKKIENIKKKDKINKEIEIKKNLEIKKKIEDEKFILIFKLKKNKNNKKFGSINIDKIILKLNKYNIKIKKKNFKIKKNLIFKKIGNYKIKIKLKINIIAYLKICII